MINGYSQTEMHKAYHNVSNKTNISLDVMKGSEEDKIFFIFVFINYFVGFTVFY